MRVKATALNVRFEASSMIWRMREYRGCTGGCLVNARSGGDGRMRPDRDHHPFLMVGRTERPEPNREVERSRWGRGRRSEAARRFRALSAPPYRFAVEALCLARFRI